MLYRRIGCCWVEVIQEEINIRNKYRQTVLLLLNRARVSNDKQQLPPGTPFFLRAFSMVTFW